MNSDHFSTGTLDFLRCLHKYEVRSLIVGGEAVIYYGLPRLTGDIDFYYDRSTMNCRRLYDALLEFWERDIPGINAATDLGEPGAIIQFGVPPNRIDLINQIDGVTFQQAWNSRETARLEAFEISMEINIIGLDQLINNKQSVKRYKDLEDLRYLREVQKKRKTNGA
jgi:hypothetical protein